MDEHRYSKIPFDSKSKIKKSSGETTLSKRREQRWLLPVVPKYSLCQMKNSLRKYCKFISFLSQKCLTQITVILQLFFSKYI